MESALPIYVDPSFTLRVPDEIIYLTNKFKDSMNQSLKEIRTYNFRTGESKLIYADKNIFRRPVMSVLGEVVFESGSLMKVDSTGKAEIFGGGMFPSWNPTGMYLAYEKSEQIVICNRLGEVTDTVQSYGNFTAWSPSGKQLAVVGHDISIFEFNQGKTRLVKSYPLDYNKSLIYEPAWIDEAHLIFTTFEGFYILDLGNGQFRPIRKICNEMTAITSAPSLSTDGNQVVFGFDKTVYYDTKKIISKSGIYIMKPDGSNMHEIPIHD